LKFSCDLKHAELDDIDNKKKVKVLHPYWPV